MEEETFPKEVFRATLDSVRPDVQEKATVVVTLIDPEVGWEIRVFGPVLQDAVRALDRLVQWLDWAGHLPRWWPRRRSRQPFWKDR